MSDEFPTMQNGQVVLPRMDRYMMQCCDCGLVHRLQFKAIRVTKHLPDGSFKYDEMDPRKYRVEMTAWRDDAEPSAPPSKWEDDALRQIDAIAQAADRWDSGLPIDTDADGTLFGTAADDTPDKLREVLRTYASQAVREAVQREREACAKLLELSAAALRLMAGEMSAGEMRAVRAVLANRAAAIRARKP